ncbi:hypothetical protein BDZ91DRAFT_784159 [Kalaharituber pfeilii]|nr:hypothetical protein BDZ91DRAFT_784159 [Kalaharituber pfeilii]
MSRENHVSTSSSKHGLTARDFFYKPPFSHLLHKHSCSTCKLNPVAFSRSDLPASYAQTTRIRNRLSSISPICKMLLSVKHAVALASCLLFLVQGVIGTAIPVSVKCFPIDDCSPFVADCQQALKQVPKTSGEPEFCTTVWLPEYNLTTAGTCTIQTYSDTRGKAHCLDNDKIRDGVKKILSSCTSAAKVEGQYEWSTVPGVGGEGVRLISAK